MVSKKKLTPVDIKKYTGFTVSIYSIDGPSMIKFTDEGLVEILQSYTNHEELYVDETEIDANAFLQDLPNLENLRREFSVLSKFVEFLRSHNKDFLSKVDNLIKKNSITFYSLPYVFVSGTEIFFDNDGQLQGGTVVSSNIQKGYFISTFNIVYDSISTTGSSYITVRKNISINEFDGVTKLDSLPVRLINSEIKLKLTERGHRFKAIGLGSHYYYMNGHMQIKQWWNWSDLRSTGRCMIDTSAYSLFKANHYDRRDSSDSNNIDVINENMLWQTDPYLFGFSFVTKQWGRFAVEDLREIDFNDNAFDQLVLDENKKNLIKALVIDSNSGFKDIIHGKGGGCIFLLHGEPGVGKTLTAEAIAELLRRPLYSVSVGELGTDTDSLEKNLRQILDVAQFWNAVILIDEADIFLEKRTTGDILRNAMVGIFLKLLEYHQGVLFLTTNRVNEFDSAFHSRISIALKYKALDAPARKTIWDNLLKAAGIEGLDTDELATMDINGRQIKNTIRLAQGLARQQGIPVNQEHINLTIEISRQFQNEIKGDSQ